METDTFRLPPFFIEVDGCPVQVLEVLESELVSGDTWYHIVLSIEYKGVKSKIYSLDCKDIKDLVNKLKIEITKIKFMDYGYGMNEVRRAMA